MNEFLQKIKGFAESQGDKLCFCVDDKSYTYRDFWEETLVASSHFTKGETILIEEKEEGIQLFSWLGAILVGAVPLLAHPDMPEERVEQLIAKAGLNGTREEAQVPEKADFGVLTSGSTGLPKVWWRAFPSWMNFFPAQNEVFHVSKKSVLFLHGSFSFTGNLNAALATLYEGGTVVLSASLKATRWIRTMEMYGATHIYLLPTKVRMLLQKVSRPLEGIEFIFMGSQSLDRHLLASLTEHIPRAEVMFYYGASELNYITYCTLQEWEVHPGTVGKPFSGVSVTVNEESEIVVDTPYSVEAVPRPFVIGDKGKWTEDGYLLFLGRTDGMINSSGYKIAVQGLEDTIRSCEGVQDVVVLSVADSLRGEVPVAFVVPCEEHECDTLFVSTLHRCLAKRLPAIEVPRVIRVIEELPLSATSKVDKEKLRKLL